MVQQIYSSEYNRQCVFILQACITSSDDTQILVDARDRGGLWRVNKNMQCIFLTYECIFRSKTAKFSVKIVSADIVNSMLKNYTIMSDIKSICYKIDPIVNGEFSMELLELYSFN